MTYAEQSDLDFMSIQNRDGYFIKASLETVSEAAAGAAKDMPKDYRVSITNAPGKNSWPISTFTWLLVFEKNNEGKGNILRDFLKWAINDGQKFAGELGYAPLPTTVRAMIEKTIQRIN